jgi:hypothetical protein
MGGYTTPDIIDYVGGLTPSNDRIGSIRNMVGKSLVLI